MHYYYSVFRPVKDGVDVRFIDLPELLSFGKTWDDAIVNAYYDLVTYISNQKEFIIKQSSRDDVQGKYSVYDHLVPICVDDKIIDDLRSHRLNAATYNVTQHDETQYLLKSAENRKRLLESIDEIEDMICKSLTIAVDEDLIERYKNNAPTCEDDDMKAALKAFNAVYKQHKKTLDALDDSIPVYGKEAMENNTGIPRNLSMGYVKTDERN